MNTQIDFKQGISVFPDRVDKAAVPVVVQTGDSIISGDLHIRAINRVIDELIRSEDFLAITNATVYNLTGKVRFRSKFLSLNRSHIVYVIPKEEMINQPAQDSGQRLPDQV